MSDGVLGIDAGGSSARARYEHRDRRVLFERTVGGANPRTLPPALVARRLSELLEGCPSPHAVAACVAGMSSAETRALVGRCLAERFPGAAIRLEPDYAAALRRFDQPVSMCVVAGTGSIVCSRSADGRIETSGGKGYLLGDQGSAFRLGQALVSAYATDPTSVGDLGPSIDAVLGVGDSGLVATVHDACEPAALLARAAPVLTGAADEGIGWARRLLDAEMDLLASIAVLHSDRRQLAAPLVVGLAGGVWTSGSARDSFGAALARRSGGETRVVGACRTAVVGATELARELL